MRKLLVVMIGTFLLVGSARAQISQQEQEKAAQKAYEASAAQYDEVAKEAAEQKKDVERGAIAAGIGAAGGGAIGAAAGAAAGSEANRERHEDDKKAQDTK